MDGEFLSPFPRLSWIGFSLHTPPRCFHLRSVCHGLSVVLEGRHSVRWISGRQEMQWTEDVGAVRFQPADNEEHTFQMWSDVPWKMFCLLIPPSHLQECLALDGCRAPVEVRPIRAPNDPVLRYCMTQLACPVPSDDPNSDAAQDMVARRLLLRVAELSGGHMPEWYNDHGVFERPHLAALVEYINAHLKHSPCLSDMANRVGLSPSHFAKKFHRSTGLSLHHFINRRRICASMDMLTDLSLPIAHIALELGFSSQSHFTRVFHDMTGMTPAKYQKQFRQTMG